MYNKILAIISSFIIMFCLTGCQSTPDDSLIVNKTDGNIESLIGQQAEGPVVTDGHITETITCCGYCMRNGQRISQTVGYSIMIMS